MDSVMISYRQSFADKAFLFSVIFSFTLLFMSFAVNYEAGLFATRNMSNSVTDIVLDNTTARDVDGIFNYGPMVFWAFVSVILLCFPRKIPFTVKSVALFIFIRSIFISMTHIAPFPGQLEPLISSVGSWFTFGGDLFFSAHTGLPFLLALLFWDNRVLRYIFLLSSVFFGVVVLFGHYHYSIDVFGAPFITYTIAAMAHKLFKNDYLLFTQQELLTLQ